MANRLYCIQYQPRLPIMATDQGVLPPLSVPEQLMRFISQLEGKERWRRGCDYFPTSRVKNLIHLVTHIVISLSIQRVSNDEWPWSTVGLTISSNKQRRRQGWGARPRNHGVNKLLFILRSQRPPITELKQHNNSVFSCSLSSFKMA